MVSMMHEFMHLCIMPTLVYQPNRVGMVLEYSPGELLAPMHHGDKGHNTLKHYAALKGLARHPRYEVSWSAGHNTKKMLSRGNWTELGHRIPYYICSAAPLGREMSIYIMISGFISHCFTHAQCFVIGKGTPSRLRSHYKGYRSVWAVERNYAALKGLHSFSQLIYIQYIKAIITSSTNIHIF